MGKDITYCDNVTCLTRTCSRHRCQAGRWYDPYLSWSHWGAKDCEMYQGEEDMGTIFRKDYPEEEELD